MGEYAGRSNLLIASLPTLKTSLGPFANGDDDAPDSACRGMSLRARLERQVFDREQTPIRNLAAEHNHERGFIYVLEFLNQFIR